MSPCPLARDLVICKLCSGVQGEPRLQVHFGLTKSPKTRLVATNAVSLPFFDSIRFLVFCQSWILGSRPISYASWLCYVTSLISDLNSLLFKLCLQSSLYCNSL